MPNQLLFLPGPVTVAQPVLEAAARPMIDHRGPEFAALLERVIAALRPVYGTSGEIAVLGSSGTGAMEAAIVNLFSPGERLLSCAVGAFGNRFAAIAQGCGCIVESLSTPLGSALDPQALRRRLEDDTQHTIAGVLLTHNETSTGVANDMAAIAPILRAHGALTLVDSVSGLGASEFLMDAWGYDAVATASQKAFAAPPGVATIALSDRARARLSEQASGRYYFDLRSAIEFARIGQTPWTPPIATIFAFDAALARYHAEGMQAAFARHARNAQKVRAALQGLGFTLFSRPGAHSDTVVAAYPPSGVDPSPLLRRLREEHGVVLSGGQGELAGKIVRFGTMGAVSDADFDRALTALESTLAGLTSGVA
ncbi:MAG TPA: alanine--glyoxylate aminotransferase family protein [Candidatus Cybelea sp.]|jgi:aspartate aminotransferase-like enzyme|nr:alanine--glyoxylate aminotransferase family protein [Candidatus Cybelea sp.]